MDTNANSNEIRIIKIRDVIALTGLSRSSIYQAIKQGSFPVQVKLSARSSGWLRSEVVEWVQARPRGKAAVG